MFRVEAGDGGPDQGGGTYVTAKVWSGLMAVMVPEYICRPPFQNALTWSWRWNVVPSDVTDVVTCGCSRTKHTHIIKM